MSGIPENQLRVARGLWSRLQPLDAHVPSRLQRLLADRRFGSRDRRLYRELLLTAVRHARVLPVSLDEGAWAALIATRCAERPETLAFRARFARDVPPTDPLDLAPAWFVREYEGGAEAASRAAAALLARAPVWTRLQVADAGPVLAEWASRGWTASPADGVEGAWRLPPETPATDTDAYRSGHYEIQDLGSQLVLASLDLPTRKPGARWLDLCAGAGGKTLQLASHLGQEARVVACDPRAAALEELRARARRAGLGARIEIRSQPADGARYDGVLVDAPCSGSGTWRRSPHLMACTDEAGLAACAARQREILAGAARFVRPGGLLVYATCSVARSENSAVALDFLARESGRFEEASPASTRGFAKSEAGVGLLFEPGLKDNDGLYVAVFRRVEE